MRIRRIYVDANYAIGSTIDLPGETVNYLRNVLRLKNNQSLQLFNGRGQRAVATLTLERRNASVRITAVTDSESEQTIPITLIAALAKGEKMEWIIQKAVELGVKEIAPVTTERSVPDLNDARAEKRRSRWQQIMINACEQCHRDTLPTINPISQLATALQATQADTRLVLDPRAAQSLSTLKSQPPPDSVAFLVGPEGGFTPEEVALADAAHFRALSLGPRILRAETAAIAGMAVLQYQWGDLG